MSDRLGIQNPLYLDSSTALSRIKQSEFGAPSGWDFDAGEQRIPSTPVAATTPEPSYGLMRQRSGARAASDVQYGPPTGWKYEEPAPAPEPIASTPPSNDNNFTRNFKKSLYQAKQTGYGAAALIGDTIGSEAIKTFGLEGYKDVEKDVQKYSAANDSFTHAISKDGSITQWMTGAAGYLTGQVLESGAAALAGFAIGSALPGAGSIGGAVVGTIEKEAIKSGIRGRIASMVEKQYASRLAAGMSEEAAAKAVGASLLGTIGANAGNFLFNATQELGSIYGDAIQESAKTGQEYSLGKIWLTGIGAAALDSVTDTVAFKGLTKAIGGERQARSFLSEAFRAGAREAVTETAQTALERYGANKDLTSHEALVEYVDSAALGAFGGAMIGGGTKLATRSKDVKQPEVAQTAVDGGGTTTTQSGTTESPGEVPFLSANELRRTMESDRGGSFVAAIYENASPEDQKMISMAIDRAGTTARKNFDAALSNEDALISGRELLATHSDFADRFMQSLPEFSANPSRVGEYKMPPKGRTAEQFNNQLDADQTDEGYWDSLRNQADSEGTARSAAPAKQAPYQRIAELEALGSATGLTREQYAELNDLRMQEEELRRQEEANNDRFRFSRAKKPTEPGMPRVITGEAAQSFLPAQESPAQAQSSEPGAIDLSNVSSSLTAQQILAEKARARGVAQKNLAGKDDVIAARNAAVSAGLNPIVDQGAFNSEVATRLESLGFDGIAYLAEPAATIPQKTANDSKSASSVNTTAVDKLNAIKAENASRPAPPAPQAPVKIEKWQTPFPALPAEPTAQDLKQRVSTLIDRFRNPEDFSKTFLSRGDSERLMGMIPGGVLSPDRINAFESELAKAEARAQKNVADWTTREETADPRAQAFLRQTLEMIEKTRDKFKLPPRQVTPTKAATGEDIKPLDVVDAISNPKATKGSVAAAQREIEADLRDLRDKLVALKKPNAALQIGARSGLTARELGPIGERNRRAESPSPGEGKGTRVSKPSRKEGKKVAKPVTDFKSAYNSSQPFRQLVDLMALSVKRGLAKPTKSLRDYPQAVRDLNNSFKTEERDEAGTYLARFGNEKDIQSLADAAQDTTYRPSDLTPEEQSLVNKFKAKVERIVSALYEGSSYRQKISEYRDQIDELNEKSKSKPSTDEPTYIFAQFHEKDIREYGESYFVDRSYNEADFARARARDLSDQIIALQNDQLEARARVLREQIDSFKDELEAARQDALAAGTPEKQVEEIFSKADASLDAVLDADDIPDSVNIQDIANEDGPPAVIDNGPTTVQDFVEAFKNLKGENPASLVEEAKVAIRSGDITYEDLRAGFRSAGLPVPLEVLGPLSHPSARMTLTDWIAANGNRYEVRHAWFGNLYERRKLSPGKLLSEAEEAEFQAWVEAKESFSSASRKPRDENILDVTDFSDALFYRFKLNQMRNLDLISNQRTRTFVNTLFSDPVDAWFNDLHYALTVAPDLKGAISDPKNGVVTPADWVAYQNWNTQRLAAKQKEAEIKAKSAQSSALANLKGIDDKTYQKYSMELAIADINEREAILRDAATLSDYILRAQQQARAEKSLAALDDYYDQFLDDVAVRDELDATPLNGFDPSIESEVAVPSDRPTDIELNDDGEVVHRDTDDQHDPSWDRSRLARGRYTGVLSNAIVRSIVDRITRGWAQSPHVVVLQNAGQLPQDIRDQVLGKLNDVDLGAKGLFDSKTGTVYLFSDFLAGEADVQFTFAHEVLGHYGLRAFLGNKLDAMLELVYNSNSKLKAAVDRRMQATGEPKLEVIEEVLADMQGRGQNIGMFKQIVGKLITALRKVGFNTVADWVANSTDAEIANLLLSARKAARGEIMPYKGAPDSVRLAQARMPYELFSMKARVTTAYARYNPIADEWFVFSGQLGNDIKTGNYTSLVMKDYEDVLEYMRKQGRVERRTRSGLYLDNKLGEDMVTLPKVDDVGPIKRKLRELQMYVQNEYLPVFQAVDFLDAQGKINDSNNVKKALLLYERKAGVWLQDFDERHVKPLMKLIEEANKAGADKDFINDYMVARSAEERNIQVRKTNPRVLYGSGMSPNGEQGKPSYNKILQEARDRNLATVLEKIGAITDRLGDAKVDMEMQFGLITKKDGEARKAAYRHYINMSGVNPVLFPDEESEIAGAGRLFNMRGQSKNAFGRGDVAPDVIARTILAFEASIIRSHKNVVAQKVLALMESCYDPSFVVINEQEIKPRYDKELKTTVYEVNQQYIQRDDVMVAKVKGIPVTMRFKQTGKGTFAEAIHGYVAPRETGPLTNLLGKYNKLLGQMITSWNPAWVMVNFIRDVQTLFFNAAADKKVTKAMAFKMVKETRKAAGTAMAIALEQYDPKGSKGQAAKAVLQKLVGKPDFAMRAMYEEARKAGALTSFLNRKDLDSQIERIGVALGGKDPWAKLRAVTDFIELMTIPTEMAPRLAAYKVMRDHGYSKSDSAVFAGGITVNFNMRGTGKELRQWYLFFNPAIQGTAQLFSLAAKNPKVFGSIAVGWVAFGALMSFFGRAMSGDDEDGINKLDKVPLFKRSTSAVISANVPGAAIPIPYGWNAFYSIGTFMADAMMGEQTLATSAARSLKASFEAFSPVGGSALDTKQGLFYAILKTATPTAFNGATEWFMNENRFGAPIRKTAIQGRASDPEPYMAFEGTSPISKMIAQGVHNATGGSRWSQDGIQFNPAVIDHFLGAYAPGLITETYKAASMAVRTARGEEVRNAPIPLLDRFTARVPDGWNAGAFRRAQELVDTKWREFENEPDRTRIDKWRDEYAGLGQAKQIIDTVRKQVRGLEAANNALENSSRPDEEKVAFKNRVKEYERDLYARAVKAVMNIGKDGNSPFRDAILNAE